MKKVLFLFLFFVLPLFSFSQITTVAIEKVEIGHYDSLGQISWTVDSVPPYLSVVIYNDSLSFISSTSKENYLFLNELPTNHFSIKSYLSTINNGEEVTLTFFSPEYDETIVFIVVESPLTYCYYTGKTK